MGTPEGLTFFERSFYAEAPRVVGYAVSQGHEAEDIVLVTAHVVQARMISTKWGEVEVETDPRLPEGSFMIRLRNGCLCSACQGQAQA